MLNFEIVWGHHICLDMAINRSTVNHFGSTALWWIGSDFVRGLHAAMVHHFGLSGNRVEVSSMGWGNEGGLGSRGLGGKLARERRFRSLRVATPNISSFRQAWNFIFETSLLLLGFESQSRGITSKMAVMEEQNKMECPICLMSNVIDMQQGGLF